MGGFQGLLRWFATSLVLAGLAACGGGGGGSSAMPAPPATATFTPSQNSLSFAGNAFASASTDADGGQVTLTADATGRARFITLNIPLGGAASYNHTFDLATALAGDPTSGFAGFILLHDGARLSDGSSPNNLILDPSLNFSTYGIWIHVQSADASTGTETGAVGGIAFGNLTPVGGLPMTGLANYSGRTVGAAITGTTQTLLAGTATLNANFQNMNMSGTFVLSNAVTGASWSTLTLQQTAIVAMGGSYTYGGINTVTGTIPGGAVSTSNLNGHFYGPTGEETAGTWSVANSSTHAVGAFGAKRQ